MPAYFDCNATTPVDPRVQAEVIKYFSEEFGNPGSRTHEFGSRAKRAVEHARDQIGAAVGASRDEIIFTSGATESNNLSILGLAEYGIRSGRKHIISTQIEHKAVIEPLELLASRGFDITLISPTHQGWIDPHEIHKVLRSDTLLVSVMHVNNETGVIQPISEIAKHLAGHPAYFHVDAAQGFGKDLEPLKDSRLDLVSISGHKIFAPKGVGALIVRRRGYERVPLAPLMVGGGQERGLRPGTLPTPLIVGLGKAAELAMKEWKPRAEKCAAIKARILKAFEPLKLSVNGDPERTLPHVLNLSFARMDSEAVIVVLKDLVAVSNGSACTSAKYQPSHVLKAMALSDERIKGAIRFSWSHLCEEPNWDDVRSHVQQLTE